MLVSYSEKCQNC